MINLSRLRRVFDANVQLVLMAPFPNERARGPQADEQKKDPMSKQLRDDSARGDPGAHRRSNGARSSRIRPNAKNSRTHSRKQIRQIAASIRKFGFLNPLIVDDRDMILAGRGRLEGARWPRDRYLPGHLERRVAAFVTQ